MTSADLIAILAGADADPASWAALVQRHGPRLWAVARAAAGNRLADDAFQEGLIAIRKAARRFRPGTDPEASAIAWMVTVVHCAAIDLLRRETRRARREGAAMPDEDPIAADVRSAGEREAISRAAMQALEHLPERHRQVIRLRLLGGLDAAQTASVLQCPPDQVRVRLARALEHLRRRIGGAQASALPAAALADCLHRAASPPAALSPAAHAAAIASFTTPVATGLSLGAIMAFSALGCAVAATAVITLANPFGAAHAADAGAVPPGPVAASATTAAATPPPVPAPDAAAIRDAHALLVALRMPETMALDVEKFSRQQGIDASADDFARATAAVVNGDGGLIAEETANIARHYSAAQLGDYLRFLATPAGRAFGATHPPVQQMMISPAMDAVIRAIMESALQALDHPDAMLPASGSAADPDLDPERSLWTAIGFEAAFREQLVAQIVNSRPKHSALEAATALSRAIAARPDWIDPVLKVYQQHLTQADMDAVFDFFSTTPGRQVVAAMPGIVDEFNATIIRQLPQLIERTREKLDAATEPAPANKGF